jgi:hypothetical protein
MGKSWRRKNGGNKCSKNTIENFMDIRGLDQDDVIESLRNAVKLHKKVK